MTLTSELIKISSLQERYRLDSRQAVYDRINGLQIQPVARGKISQEQLELLDRLDKHIRSGGAIADFPVQPEVQLPALDKLDKLDKVDRLDIEPDQMMAINVMAELMEKMMSYTYTRQTSPLSGYEELEKAVQFGWVLPTSKIKELIGASPKLQHDEQVWQRGCFTFSKHGKIGSETGWRVEKETYNASVKTATS
ncbi:hypothetical protein [Dendronalium sp. ChiSLP03b]|uniref:hypothetical protein n=1 Tax=Dendronalium sp. ChiSLP03b TaxID=3075381 RepID=UPI003919EE57